MMTQTIPNMLCFPPSLIVFELEQGVLCIKMLTLPKQDC